MFSIQTKITKYEKKSETEEEEVQFRFGNNKDGKLC